MEIITKGHAYKLRNFEGDTTQELKFIHKVPNGDNLQTIENGTTNEEVLSVLINRMNSLQEDFPCRENAIVITKLEECLMWLNKRTKDRQERGVEGKHIK